MRQSGLNLETDKTFYVRLVSKHGQVIGEFRLTGQAHGVRTLAEAKSRAEEILADKSGNGLVMIVTEGHVFKLDKTQRLVLSKVLPADFAIEPGFA